MASDDQFTNNLVLRSLKDQIQRVGTCAPSLPEHQPMSDEKEELLEQIAELIKYHGNMLERDTKLNKLVAGFSKVANPQDFQRLADKVFVDGITWGNIVSLICVIGKSIAEVIANFIPGFVSWTLDYFRDKLLNWICSRGGWINSISSLVRSSFERDFGSSSSLISLSSGVLFMSGVLLGGLIVWRLNRCA